MAESQDTEITLGTGRLLTLFFGLVAVCAVFFGLGYSAGKGSVKASSDAAPAPSTAMAHSPDVKPSANPPGPTPAKAVEQKSSADQTTGTSQSPDSGAKETSGDPKSGADPTVAPPTSGYYVQVAAVRDEGDAQALVEALKKKQYAAFSATAEIDKLYHVQIGPFAEVKDAEAIRTKLVSDGYNPILKK